MSNSGNNQNVKICMLTVLNDIPCLIELLGADLDSLRRPQLLVLHVVDLDSQVLKMQEKFVVDTNIVSLEE